jgi:hypothetical protein
MKMHCRLFMILLIGPLSLANCAPYNIKIELPAVQLQAALDKYFPLFLPGLDYITVLDAPELALLQDQVQIHTRLVIPGEQAQQPLAAVNFTARLVYQRDNVTFYLQELQLAGLESALLDESGKQAAAAAIKTAIASRLKEIHVYTLNQQAFKARLATYFLQDVAVFKDKLLATLALIHS